MTVAGTVQMPVTVLPGGKARRERTRVTGIRGDLGYLVPFPTFHLSALNMD